MPDTYFHFAICDDAGTPRLGYSDGREIRVGETLTVAGPPVLCERGLHASQRIIDALQYAHDSRLALCAVTLGGEIAHDVDKSVATERTVVVMLTPEQNDALLRRFARWCVLSVAHLWDMPDVVRRYLETGDETIRDAARAAAWAAAGAAARAAVRDAARAAAWAAAGDAAGAAARAAAWAAAGAAAGDAAGDAVRDAARAAAGAAAWAAAGAAARAAAWAAAWAAAGDAAWAAARDVQEAALRRLFDEYANR